MKKTVVAMLSCMCLYAGADVARTDVFSIWTDPVPAGRNPDAVPLVPGVEQVTVLHATAATGGYNHNSRIFFHKGLFHALWSNHRYGEDAPGQRVLHVTSMDGLAWSDPGELMPAVVPEAPHGRTGLFSYGCEIFSWQDRLFAEIRISSVTGWDNRDHSVSSPVATKECRYPVYKAVGRVFRELLPAGGYGVLFTDSQLVLSADLLPKVVPISEACPGFSRPRAPYNLADAFRQNPENRRFCEPAIWRTKGGRFVSLLRDDTGGQYKWITVSDDGFKWTRPRMTDMPDAPSLSCAAALPDGRILLVGNHAHWFRDESKKIHVRDPLMISLSEDGVHFVRTWSVYRGCPEPRVPNVVYRGGGASYANIIVVGRYCYVIYSIGREDIGLSRIPLTAFDGKGK